MAFTDEISARVKARLGLRMGPHKEYLLEARLERLRSREGYSDLSRLLVDLDSNDPRAWDAVSRHVTTNHTYFFREEQHFRLVADLLARAHISSPRLWSAAGSTGEEAYSLAMTLGEAGFSDYLILVSDVNKAVLQQASEGVYDGSRMARVPRGLVDKYFHREGSDYRVNDALRQKLRFRPLNLCEVWTTEVPLDAIFCRNLFIYFDAQDISRVLDRLVDSLKPGGWLFLGLTEGFQVPPGTRRIAPAAYQKLGGPEWVPSKR